MVSPRNKSIFYSKNNFKLGTKTYKATHRGVLFQGTKTCRSSCSSPPQTGTQDKCSALDFASHHHYHHHHHHSTHHVALNFNHHVAPIFNSSFMIVLSPPIIPLLIRRHSVCVHPSLLLVVDFNTSNGRHHFQVHPF